MIVSELANTVLTSALLPHSDVDQTFFARSTTIAEIGQTVQAGHIRRLLEEPIPVDRSKQLSSTSEGETALEEVETAAQRWLSDVLEPAVEDLETTDRRGSLFSMSGPMDEEIELIVTVLVS